MSTLVFNPPLNRRENKRLRDDFTERVAARIKEVRKEKGLTQEELSEKAALNPTYTGKLEQGVYHPTVYVMWKLAKALGVSLDQLTNV